MPQSTTNRVRVFISSVTSEFLDCRRQIQEALLGQKILPISQETFPPDYRSVIEILEDSIRACDAVIALVGFRFGAAPVVPAGPRRSFTQLEHDVARNLGKPVFWFFASDSYTPYQPAAEPPEDVRLQATHRESLLQQDCRYEFFSNATQLTFRIAGTIPAILELGARKSLPLGAIRFPKPPILFAGRELESQQLTNALDRSVPSLTAVVGVAGQGKSTLVAHWIREHAGGKFRAQFWCSFSPDVSVDLFLEEILNYLLEGNYIKPQTRDRAGQIRRLLNLLHASLFLIVLDNLEHRLGNHQASSESAALEDFLLQATAITSGSQVVITSRILPTVLDGAMISIVPVYPDDKRMQLEGLDEEAAIALLKRHGAKGEREDLLMKANAYSRHPLALTLAARIAAKHDGGILLGTAGEPKQRVFKLFQEVLHQSNASPEMEQLLQIVSMALESLHLDALKYVFGSVDKSQARSWTHLLSRFVTRSPNTKGVDLIGAIQYLSDWHLIEWDSRQKEIRMHSLVREFFAARCSKSQVVHEALSEWYGRQPIADDISTLQQVQPRIIALEHALRGGDRKRAEELFFGPLTRRHNLAEWLLQFGHLAREIPSRIASLLIGQARAECLIVRAAMSRQLGALGDALADLHSAIQILRSISRARHTLANAFMNRGNVNRQLCRYNDALSDYSSSLDLLRTAKDPFREAIALLLLNRAALLHDMGYCSRGLSDADAAVKLLEGGQNSISLKDLPSALLIRGSIQADMELASEGILDYDRAASLWVARISAGEAECEARLASLRIVRSLSLSDMSQTDAALLDLEGALRFLEGRVQENHTEFEPDLAVATINLAAVQRRGGQLENALVSARRSVDLYKMLFDSGRLELEGYLAHALLQTARVAGEVGDWVLCRSQLEEGLAVSRGVLRKGQTDLLIPFLNQVGAVVWLLFPVDSNRAAALANEVLEQAADGLRAHPKSDLNCRKIAQFIKQLDESEMSVLKSINPANIAWLRQNSVI